jgi:multicomponent Na+:H+ antiporter subunit E
LKYTWVLGIVLAAVWLAWSGHTESLILIFGALSCLMVLGIARRMRIVDREGAPIEPMLRSALYLPWLMWEVVKANLDVVRRILSPRLPIEPNLIRLRAGQRTDLGRVIYANSITLTPGTVSIELHGEEIVVHALTREAARGVESGEMDRRVRRLEGGS